MRRMIGAVVPAMALAAIVAAATSPWAVARQLGASVGAADSQTTTSAVALSIAGGSATLTVRRLEGDVNGDCRVDVNDDQIIANKYLAATGSLRYSPAYDVNLPYPDGVIDIKDLQFVVGRNRSTCKDPIPPQPPVAAPSPPQGDLTLTKDPSSANIWLCAIGAGDCGNKVPTELGPDDWQNGIVISEVLTINVPVPGIEGYRFLFAYDPNIFQPPTIDDLGVLDNGGQRTTTCTETPEVGGALVECKSTGPPGSAVRWTGARTIAKVTLAVQPTPPGSLRPAKENGLVTQVQDVSPLLETTTQPTPTPTSSPSPSSTATPPLATSTPAPGASATRSPAASVTQTAVPTATASPTGTRSPVVTSTVLGGEAKRTPTLISTVVGVERRKPPTSGLPSTGEAGTPTGGGVTWIAFALGVGVLLSLGWFLRAGSSRPKG